MDSNVDILCSIPYDLIAARVALPIDLFGTLIMGLVLNLLFEVRELLAWI